MTTPVANIDNTTLLALTGNLDIGDVADPALRLTYFQYLNVYIQTITTAFNLFIANGSVGSANLADLSVLTAKIADLAVTTGKIAELAVTTAKLNDMSVTLAKMAAASVGTTQLVDLSVTRPKIAAGAVGAAQLDPTLLTDYGDIAVQAEFDRRGINPMKYGAVGDGVTDDSTELQATLDAQTGNVIINLVGRSYLINTSLTMSSKNNVRLVNGEIINKSGGLAITFTDCDYLEIDKITINSNNQSITGIRVVDSENPVIRNSTFRNVAGVDCSLIRIIGCPNAIIDNCLIENVTATNSGVGIYIDDDANVSENFTVINCVIKSIYPVGDGDGIKVQSACKNGVIQNNKFYDCQKRFAKLQQSAGGVSYGYVTIKDNYASGGMIYAGIDAQCGNALIQNNQIIDCGGYGISLQGYNCKVIYNTIKSASLIVGAAGSAIQIADLGYAITSAKTITIENNDISGTAYYGVLLRDTMLSVDRLSIKNNTFKNLLGRYTVFSVAACTISELIISENIINIAILNYLLLFDGTLTSLVVQTLIIKDNKMPTSQNITVLNRASIELICATASLIDIRLLNMNLQITITGGTGKTKYRYLSDTAPLSIAGTVYFYRYNLENSKIGDFVEINQITLNGTDKLNMGWYCIEAAGANVRGLWKVLTVDIV